MSIPLLRRKRRPDVERPALTPAQDGLEVPTDHDSAVLVTSGPVDTLRVAEVPD